MNQFKIKVILGSVREGRFGEAPAKWITEIAKKTPGLDVELLDLRDYPLPMFAEAVSPAHVEGPYRLAEVNEWAKKIAEADGFIIVTPEYNNGYSAALKNNIDHLYREWNKKPVCFVGYGTTGGAGAINQLRLLAVEMQMAPIRKSVHIFNPWFLKAEDGTLATVLKEHEKSAETMIDQFVWWVTALSVARNKQ